MCGTNLSQALLHTSFSGFCRPPNLAPVSEGRSGLPFLLSSPPAPREPAPVPACPSRPPQLRASFGALTSHARATDATPSALAPGFGAPLVESWAWTRSASPRCRVASARVARLGDEPAGSTQPQCSRPARPPAAASEKLGGGARGTPHATAAVAGGSETGLFRPAAQTRVPGRWPGWRGLRPNALSGPRGGASGSLSPAGRRRPPDGARPRPGSWGELRSGRRDVRDGGVARETGELASTSEVEAAGSSLKCAENSTSSRTSSRWEFSKEPCVLLSTLWTLFKKR